VRRRQRPPLLLAVRGRQVQQAQVQERQREQVGCMGMGIRRAGSRISC
jgi:hypothetical protein